MRLHLASSGCCWCSCAASGWCGTGNATDPQCQVTWRRCSISSLGYDTPWCAIWIGGCPKCFHQPPGISNIASIVRYQQHVCALAAIGRFGLAKSVGRSVGQGVHDAFPATVEVCRSSRKRYHSPAPPARRNGESGESKQWVIAVNRITLVLITTCLTRPICAAARFSAIS